MKYLLNFKSLAIVIAIAIPLTQQSVAAELQDSTDSAIPVVKDPDLMRPATGMTTEALLAAMQRGGNVIYVRHADTERNYSDQVLAVLGDCSTQRVLSEEGWKQAKKIGEQFRNNHIPYHKVISSDYCRAWQTADLAFGQFEKDPALDFVASAAYTPGQWQIMSDNLTPLLKKMPPKGTNTILVGHDDPFNAATLIYPAPMGSTWIIKPYPNGKYQVLGSIAPQDWPSEKTIRR